MTNGNSADRLPHLAASIGADYANSFAACRELLAPMFDLDTPSPEERAGFAMEFALYDYGPIKLGRCSRTSASIMVRSPELIARSGVDHFHVQFYRSNGFVMTVDGAERRVEAGDVAMLDLARPVALGSAGVDNLSAIIDRDLLEPLLAEVGDFHGLVLARESDAAIVVREHLEEMWSQGAHLTVTQGIDRCSAAAASIAAVVAAHGQGRPENRAELRRSQFRAICRRIDKQIADPELNAAVLARDFYVTRPTLYRMFEAHGGVARYVLSRRLTGVFRDLSDPSLKREKIAAILGRWGFVNHTAAGRAFRATYGLTPSQCRARALDAHRSGAIAGRTAFDVPSEIPASVRAFQGRPAEASSGDCFPDAIVATVAGRTENVQNSGLKAQLSRQQKRVLSLKR